MGARLPYVYTAIILAELVALSYVFLTDPPAASDPLSINLGWVGLISMMVLLVYSVARRSRSLRRFARLSFWLHFHIFLAVQGFLLVLFHCWHLFGRAAEIMALNPGILNLAAVLVVFGSGLFGRYLYSTLPRSVGGVQLAGKEVDSELAGLGIEFSAEVEALWREELDEPKGIVGMVKADLATRRALRKLRRMGLTRDQLAVAARKVKLERTRAALKISERIFRWWIILHRPIAGIMYVLSIVHVLLSYMFTPSLGQ